MHHCQKHSFVIVSQGYNAVISTCITIGQKFRDLALLGNLWDRWYWAPRSTSNYPGRCEPPISSHVNSYLSSSSLILRVLRLF